MLSVTGRRVGSLVSEQARGRDAHDGVRPAELDEGACDGAHDAGGAAAVDELDGVLVHGAGEGAGGGQVGGGGTRLGTAEDADAGGWGFCGGGGHGYFDWRGLEGRERLRRARETRLLLVWVEGCCLEAVAQPCSRTIKMRVG